MPLIKARTRGKHLVRHITRLDRENYETLFAYAAFLGEPHEYVLNQLIDTVSRRTRNSSRGARRILARTSRAPPSGVLAVAHVP